MAEGIKEREIIRDRRSGSSLLGWLALILAAAALVLAWIAYNRTGEDLESKIQDQVNEAVQTTEQTIQEETPNTN